MGYRGEVNDKKYQCPKCGRIVSNSRSKYHDVDPICKVQHTRRVMKARDMVEVTPFAEKEFLQVGIWLTRGYVSVMWSGR